jgi:acetyl/propionyl-CoA carboxylase alpha subunit
VCCLLQVGTNYDPMIAKIVTHAADRESALQLLRQALAETQVGNFYLVKQLRLLPA